MIVFRCFQKGGSDGPVSRHLEKMKGNTGDDGRDKRVDAKALPRIRVQKEGIGNG